MKRLRRVSIRVAHRELTLTLTQTASPQVNPPAGRPTEPPGGDSPVPDPPVCPECGAAWLNPFSTSQVSPGTVSSGPASWNANSFSAAVPTGEAAALNPGGPMHAGITHASMMHAGMMQALREAGAHVHLCSTGQLRICANSLASLRAPRG